MKKLVLSIAAVLAVGATAHAQQEVKFGPKAGLNISNFTGDGKADSRMGFHVGAVAEIKFNDKFAVQPEVLYSTFGAKDKVGGNEIKQNNEYISIPVMARYYIVDGFAVEAGPQISFLMKSELKGDGGAVDSKDWFNSADFGINIGASYDLPMGLFFGARYGLGLSKVGKEREMAGIKVEPGDTKNSMIQISAGYKF